MSTTFSRISSKGQIVIPAEMRKQHHLKPGMKVAINDDSGKITVEPMNRDYIRQFVGIISKDSKALETLMSERKKDTLREDKKFRPKHR